MIISESSAPSSTFEEDVISCFQNFLVLIRLAIPVLGIPFQMEPFSEGSTAHVARPESDLLGSRPLLTHGKYDFFVLIEYT